MAFVTDETMLCYCGVPMRENYNADDSPVIAVVRRADVSSNMIRARVLLMGGRLESGERAFVVLPSDKPEDRAWHTAICAMIHWLQVRGVEL